MTFSPDSKRLVTLVTPKSILLSLVKIWQSIQIWDIGTGKLVKQLRGPKIGFVSGGGDVIQIEEDGKTLKVSSREWIRYWDIESSNEIKSRKLRPTQHITGTEATFDLGKVFSSDGSLSASTSLIGIRFPSSNVNSITVWHPKFGATVLHTKQKVICLTFTADDTRLIAYEVDGSIEIWETKHLGQVEGLEKPKPCLLHGFSVSPDGRFIALGRGSTVELWNGHLDGRLGDFIACNTDISSILFSPDGHLLSVMFGQSIKFFSMPKS